MRYSPLLRGIWESFWQFGMQWTREMMLDTWAHSGKISSYGLRKINKFLDARRTSLESENGGCSLRKRELSRNARSMGPQEQYHTLLTSGVLQTCGIRTVEPDALSDELKIPKIDNKIFSVAGHKNSLGKAFDTLGGEATWLNTTHENRMLCFVGFASYLKLGCSWEKQLRLWLSLLPVPGHYIFNTQTRQGGFLAPVVWPWRAMAGHGRPWPAMAGHGWHWPTMAVHGWP